MHESNIFNNYNPEGLKSELKLLKELSELMQKAGQNIPDNLLTIGIQLKQLIAQREVPTSGQES